MRTAPMTTPHHPPNKKPQSNSNATCTHHTPSATLDILILTLTLISSTFLISSYFSYLIHTLSLLLPPIHIPPFHLLALFAVSVIALYFTCTSTRTRKCGRKDCRGLKKGMEFDLQLQSEEMLKGGGKGVREVEELPWKGGGEGNVDYECLRCELRKMAPVNGRAVLLFRLKCGCAVAKLEGWGPKRGKRSKKSLSLNAGNHG